MSVDPLSERARDLLRHYRDAESLGEADQARLLAAVQQTLATAQGGGGSHGEGVVDGGAGHPALAKAAAGVMPKILVGVVLVLAPAAWLARGALHHEHVHVSVSVSAPAPPVAANIPSDGPAANVPFVAPGRSTPWMPVAPAAAPALAAVTPEPQVAPRESPASGPSRVTRPSRQDRAAAIPVTTPAGAPSEATAAPSLQDLFPPSSAPAPVDAVTETPSTPQPPAPSGVDEEVRLLGLAYAQLRSGQPALALATIAEQQRRFPDGKLADASHVARVLALCDLGQRGAARSEAAQFLAAHPGSPFTNRLRGVCPN